LAGVEPQRLTDDLARNATILVTMGCGDSCPVVPGVYRMDWELPDPKGLSPDAVRAIRDDIRDRVSGLVNAQGVSR
jgi:arsenate reductase